MLSAHSQIRSPSADARLVLAALGIVLACLLSAAPADDPAKPFFAPQEVFNAAQAALRMDKLGALCECLTPDSRDLLAGGLALNVLAVKKLLAAGGSDEEKRLLKKIDTVLARHDLTGMNLTRMEASAADFKSNNLATRLRAARLVLEPVKNRNTFVAELATALHPSAAKGTGSLFGNVNGVSDLADLKFDGDTANGIVVHKHQGKESRRPIKFQKIAESWKIDLTAELNKAFSAKVAPK